jgi:hypothetical protein
MSISARESHTCNEHSHDGDDELLIFLGLPAVYLDRGSSYTDRDREVGCQVTYNKKHMAFGIGNSERYQLTRYRFRENECNAPSKLEKTKEMHNELADIDSWLASTRKSKQARQTRVARQQQSHNDERSNWMSEASYKSSQTPLL